ncbi:putative pantothenate kinase subunit [Trypanosoma grayi]|uniref:putative pantothenate kinase subunit n=1 Tax=Trypanosoma grayi TaxID=71804 RepID=UPI0004F40923|nr:putative pantothenate kinase subunit [Trypanosoma grayi]KEG11061.1 putative pantothenate kinase subunit [Trypanosoma grayi]
MHSRSLQNCDANDLLGGSADTSYLKRTDDARAGYAQVRVLSYNFNILPRGCGGFQGERISAFLEYVDQYDVLMLQEVYAVSVLPYFVQKRVCFQKRLLDKLNERGFSHYVISRQPSYPTIMRDNVLSDNGLIIASRFPIGQCGSYTFCSSGQNERSVRRGCLFAEVTVPLSDGGNEPVVFFNVHLRPDEGPIAASSQVMKMGQYVESVIRHLYADEDEALKAPFVVAGDFNVNGIDIHNAGQPTKRLSDLMQELQRLGGGLSEAIFDTHGCHPPTRPSKLFFPAQSKLHRNFLTPQRQDYLFVSPSVEVHVARIRKFVASSQRPYMYLSDHFGVSATLCVAATGRHAHRETLRRRVLSVSLAGEAVHERSNPLSSMKMEVIPLLMLAWAALHLSRLTLLCLGFVWLLVWWFSSRIRVLSNEKKFAMVTSVVVEGKEAVTLKQPKEYSILRGVGSLAEMWQRTVYNHKALRCLGRKSDVGEPEWSTYAAVDARVRELGAGLCALGIAPGDVIGVDCQASSKAVILELACAVYGFSTLTLVGNSTTVRALIDEYNVKVAFASRSAVASLLTCRSRRLETVVFINPFSDAVDDAVARDVGITLVSYDDVAHKGRSYAAPPPLHVDSNSVFSLVVDTATTGDCPKTVRITHGDVLRSIQTLVATSVLPTSQEKHLLVQFMPFSVVFNRIFVFGLFAHGSSVATSDAFTQQTFAVFRPTIMLAPPTLFATSAIQLDRRNERYGRVYKWVFEWVYQLRSVLINVHCRDLSVLRFLFFHSTRRQLGGRVEKIVLYASEESTPYELEEHIRVCYAPCLREVFFLPSEGVFCVDGIPAPGLRVELDPFDETARKAKIGQLAVIWEAEEKHSLPIAAKWNDDRTLRLMGPPEGVLLPVKCEYVVAAELERMFAQSRYVNDIFLHAQPSKPIIAVVAPNRDTVEFEWMQRSGRDESEKLSWTKLAGFAGDLILADFRHIAKAHSLHESHVPGHVHLHPHAFLDHESFLTPYGEIRRKCVALYFKSVIDNFNLDVASQSSPTQVCSISSEEDSTPKESVEKPVPLRVPLAIDIGGTFAKLIYVQPPGVFDVPDYLVHEASSLSETLAVRTFRFFDDVRGAEEQLRDSPNSVVGTVRFAKVPSKRIPDFVEYLGEIKALNFYGQAYRESIRATGGGAFKYASLAKKLETTFEVVREMDAVVQGLALVIRAAPESIFTVDPPTGRRYPHKLRTPPGEPLSPFPCLLVNIGSGISIIKCIGPDGSHVRVGGSPIGGATFWGLVRTMTDVTSWEEVMEIMRLDGPGDNKNVDLLVGDIYGFNAKDLPAMLSVDTVASTFGKFGTERFCNMATGMKRAHSISSDEGGDALSPTSPLNALSPTQPVKRKNKPSAIDIVRSLLNMISSNVTQLAYLHSQMQNVPNIFFAGGFVRNNPIVWSHISSTLQYWSKGECYAHFLKHDGYLGALGSATMVGEKETV